MSIAAQLREAGFKVKRTVLPGSTFWNDWTKYPFSMTNWNMRPLGVQVIALAYRTGESWNESAYSNKEFDEKIAKALTVADVDKRRELMVDIEKILQEFGCHHPALLAQDLQPLDEVGEELRHPPDLRTEFRKRLAGRKCLTENDSGQLRPEEPSHIRDRSTSLPIGNWGDCRKVSFG